MSEDNWGIILSKYDSKIDKSFKDKISRKIYKLFGIVHGSDDFYYGLVDDKGKVLLASCVGDLENMGFEET